MFIIMSVNSLIVDKLEKSVVIITFIRSKYVYFLT